MKNLLSIIFMTFLLTFSACSNDDDSPNTPKEQLVLSASTLEAEVGETVSFEVTANGTTVTDAQIYVNGSLDSQNTNFNEKGSYSIVAKKEGFQESEPLNLTVYLVETYVVGYEGNGSNEVAKLWKNGVAQNLTDGSNNAVAKSVYVSGNDVYIAEIEFNGSNNLAKLWKNGTAQNLTDGSNQGGANSVYVSGSDVYVAGFENHSSGTGTIAKLWKNGVVQDLSDGSGYALCHSVFVSSSPTGSGQVDTYVAGRELNSSSIWVAKLWKNGVAQDLTDGSNNADAKSVYVSGDDVYVVGYERNGSKNVAKLWKNGLAQDLSDGFSDANAESVYVTSPLEGSGQVDVYVAGYEEDGSSPTARLWKNGQELDLEISSIISYANAVYVSGNDVYVAGAEFSGSTLKANLWKNGESQYLTEGANISEAQSVFVVKSYE
ncbi:hypothetical protein [Xanthomarina gelatinilytica]|uniref:hypothetical protein n=1 Tax=Xanthomarina gelatinilytica TaxID=1137281 RepID=UPI003AA92199